MHPATWFKVEFPTENKAITFRPSALQPVDDDGKPLASFIVKPSVSRASVNSTTGTPLVTSRSPEQQQRLRGNSISSLSLPPPVAAASAAVTYATVSATGATTAALPRRSSASNSETVAAPVVLSVLLGQTDPDSWLHRRVCVIAGRHQGLTGLVRSSGNGWVQVDTDGGFGEIAKRAAELCVVIEDGVAGAATTTSSNITYSKKASSTVNDQQSGENTAMDVVEGLEANPPRRGRPKRQTAAMNNNDKDSSVDEEQVALPPAKRVKASSTARTPSPGDDVDEVKKGNNGSKDGGYTTGTPLFDGYEAPTALQLQRRHAKLSSAGSMVRPNLLNWQARLTSALFFESLKSDDSSDASTSSQSSGYVELTGQEWYNVGFRSNDCSYDAHATNTANAMVMAEETMTMTASSLLDHDHKYHQHARNQRQQLQEQEVKTIGGMTKKSIGRSTDSFPSSTAATDCEVLSNQNAKQEMQSPQLLSKQQVGWDGIF